jgi:hypothetical protein
MGWAGVCFGWCVGDALMGMGEASPSHRPARRRAARVEASFTVKIVA